MTRYRRSFAERNLVVIAVVGLLVLGLSFTAALKMSSLPVIGGGEVHEAIFAESGGLSAGDEVRVAGVRVGEVTEVDLRGREVVVRFRAKGVDLPDQTSAAIKVKTMLGQKFLSLDPLGDGELEGAIPMERTSTPYDVNAAFSDLSTTMGEIDTVQLEESFRALSDTFRDTPDSVRQMVDGLTAISRTISSRDQELADLLEATTDVSGTLADRNEQIEALINDGSALLSELQTRREAVHAMVTGAAALGVQVRGLVKDNEKSLTPALAKIDRVSAILERNQKELDKALRLLGPYYRVLASATGNGPWAESYLCGLFDKNGNPVLENDVVRNCQPGGAK